MSQNFGLEGAIGFIETDGLAKIYNSFIFENYAYHVSVIEVIESYSETLISNSLIENN